MKRISKTLIQASATLLRSSALLMRYLIISSSAPDGVYCLKSNDNSEIYPVYCHMLELPTKCGGGGWTLVMKLDGNKVNHIIVDSI